MKIISWNVNGLRAVAKNGELENLVFSENPEFLLFQEIKSNAEQVAFLDQKFPEYQKFYHAAEKPGYSGTAIWIKLPEKLGISVLGVVRGFPEPLKYEDTEGRVLRIDVIIKNKKFTFLSIYVPNGGKSAEAWEEKFVFYEKLLLYVNEIRQSGFECLWAGDINCAHNEIDLARPKENNGVIGFHPRERALLDKIIQNQWKDVFRQKYPQKVVYSWWHVISRARLRNVGWRIDYFFCDAPFLGKICEIEYLTHQMGSDHCPVKLEI